MIHILERPLAEIAEALRQKDVSSRELVEEAIRRHQARGEDLHAYKCFDADGALAAAHEADRMLAQGGAAPLCGIPISVKDLYGAKGLPTFGGTARQLPESWSEDAWLVSRIRSQGAVIMGKTHTVELAYGAVGTNPHWGTPRNPWDAETHRIPGGSSCGAGVSLWEGSAVIALGTDTGGSIRIPASMTGVVGHKTTKGRWPTSGVVPLSSTLDTVGALTRSAEDAAFFFAAVDPDLGDPLRFISELLGEGGTRFRTRVPRCSIWDECQEDIAVVLREALGALAPTFEIEEADGTLLDEAQHLYMHGGIAGAECRAFLEHDLPGWIQILHPTVGRRLAGAPSLGSQEYQDALATRDGLLAQVEGLFGSADLLVLPTAVITPPRLSEMDDHEAYLAANLAALRPTCPVSMLGLCAVTIPVGLDAAGMPVGLQLVARGGRDEFLLGASLRGERTLGAARNRLGTSPSIPPT